MEELKSIAADENVLTSEQGLYGNSVQVNQQARGEANGKGPKDVATPINKPEGRKQRRKKGETEAAEPAKPTEVPELSKEMKIHCRNGICIGFQKGNCHWNKCRYKHEVAVLEPPEERTTVEAGMVQVNMAESSGNKPYLVNKILIDGCSNEIIRPNCPEIWKEIMVGNMGPERLR